METGSSNGRRVRFGAFEADLQAGELRKSGIRVRLQDQPFRVLTLLLECSGEVVSREDLRQEIWPDDTFVDFDHSLNTAINKIREALGDSASHPRFVETIPRRGYRFVFPLDRPPPRESVSKVGGAALRDPAESNGPTVAQAGLLLRSLKGLLNSVPSTAWLILVAGISVLSLLLGLYIGRTGTASTEPPLRKLELSVNAGEALISPNGEMIAYLHRNRLWIRRLDETEPRELPETQGAQRLFWSPDSRFVGYLQDSVLRRISVDGGQSVEICELQLPAFGAIGLDVSWGPRGNLVFGGLLDRGLYEVPALGGSPRLLLAADRPREDHFDSPLFLEDGRTLLFGSLKVEGRYGGGANELFVLEDHVRRRVFQTVRHNIVDVCYSPSGHIIYQVRGQQIWAVPFSASSATVTGEPFLVATGRGPSVSNEGTLTYLQSCPMQDDPERGECFQYKMILKARRSGEGTLRVNASHHAECSTSHAGRDARVCRFQLQPPLLRQPSGGDLRLRGAHLAGPAVPAAVEERQGRGAPLSGQDQRTQPAADHALDPMLPPKRAVKAPPPRRRHRFPRRYRPDDIALLAAVDAAHEGLSGPAVRHILEREYRVYGKREYQRLASISPSHIYNLRRTTGYRRHHLHVTKTRARAVAIGERRRPDPGGRPAICASTRCIKATPRPAKVSITSTPSIRSRSGRSWAVARPSPRPI